MTVESRAGAEAEPSGRAMQHLIWAAGAAGGAVALSLAQSALQERAASTVIDQRLPLVAVVLLLLGWMAREARWALALPASLPLLIGAALAFPDDERSRLLAYGVVVAIGYCGALLSVRDVGFGRGCVFVLAGVFLLRWLALAGARPLREIAVAAGAIAVVAAFRSQVGALAVFTALAAAMAVPATPLRTLAIPFGVAAISAVLQLWRLRILNLPALAATGAMLMLFAWSGVVARGLPYVWRAEKPGTRVPIGAGLGRGERKVIDVPNDARWLIVSGANLPRLPEGAVVGTIDPGGLPIRIGDVADWGYMRREHFWSSHNVFPRRPAGQIRDYGYNAWVDGAGKMMVAPGGRAIRVTAADTLPHGARLQMDAFELEK